MPNPSVGPVPKPVAAPRSAPENDARRARTVVGTFVLHLRPVRVPAATIRFTHTFGLGGMSLVLLALLAVTGSLLMFVYTPVPGEAYASIERLEGERAVRRVRARDPPLERQPPRARRRPPPAARLLHRRLPRRARLELGRGPRPLRRHRRLGLHRLPAALGSARLLGGDDRHRHGGLRAGRRRGARGAAARRRGDRPGDARRPTTRCTPSGCRCCSSRAPASTSGACGARRA